MLKIGTWLQGRYEILEQIGSGGMSDVYKAKCHKLNRLVAIKVLKSEFSSDANFVSKFKMEAQAAAGLSHPNIVSVYDVVDEGDLHYIVMELIEGITLKNYISKKGRLDVREAIGIAIQVAQGMAAAHEQHIIHRDIKPQNMIISRDGKVKVADFGIARAASSQTIGATAVGSVHYISPEQARGGYSDERSDIYSLGVTMYEMVTGQVPFDGDNTVTIALSHLEDQMVPPSRLNPAVPPSLERIIMKCTEKKPERRYSSAMELIADLRRALVNPDGDFVRTTPEVDDSPTVTISQKELNIIKDSKRQAARGDSRGRDAADGGRGYHNLGSAAAESGYSGSEEDYPARSQGRSAQRPKQKRKGDDDVNPQIERLLTGVGVVVALIIVAVLLFIVVQLTGVFNKGSGGATAPVTVESTEETSSLSDTETYMPDVVGLSQADAEAKLKERGLSMKVTYDKSSTYEKGLVMEQMTEKGAVVPKHSTVSVTVSEGSGDLDLTAMGLENVDPEAAKNLLESKGLKVTMEQEASDTVEQGKLTRYEPQSVAAGGEVTLYVSSGPQKPMVKVPNIVGRTEEEAIGDLEDAGLIPGEASQKASDTVPRGTVIEQGNPAESDLAQGSAVSYTVSSGPAGAETTADAAAGHGKYYATIREEYSLKSIYGPGSAGADVEVTVRFTQNVGGQMVTKTLMEPRTVSGATILPINYTIEGAPGVLTGTLEVVDASTNTVLKSYPLEFYEEAQ